MYDGLALGARHGPGGTAPASSKMRAAGALDEDFGASSAGLVRINASARPRVVCGQPNKGVERSELRRHPTPLSLLQK
jgi:hypothetical protein